MSIDTYCSNAQSDDTKIGYQYSTCEGTSRLPNLPIESLLGRRSTHSLSFTSRRSGVITKGRLVEPVKACLQLWYSVLALNSQAVSCFAIT